MGGINEVCFEMASGGMICILNFMTFISGIQVTLRLLPKKFKSLYWWYY
jgi:hypothetical protein